MTAAKSLRSEQPNPLPADLTCPRCRLRLRALDSETLRCLSGHSFPIVDGIPDLLRSDLEPGSNVVTPTVDLTIMVLAWNEAGNLRSLLPRVRSVLERMAVGYEVVVVDAGSTDGTPQVAAEGGARVARQTEPGYGGALRMGFSVARGRYIATMDGDHQHDPDFLEAMWAQRQRADLVIASRYVDGGRADMPIYRKLFSRVLNRVYAFGLGVHFRDMSSGFRLYRRSAIAEMTIQGRNFDVLEDILLRMVADGHEVVEVPLHHKARFTGRSHVMLLQFVASYLRTFWRLRRLRNSPDSADYENWSLHSYNLLRRFRAQRRQAVIVSASQGSRRTLLVGTGSDPLLSELPEAVALDERRNKLRWARRLGRPVLRSNARVIPFPDRSFDLLLVAQHGQPETALAVDELARVLTPDGRLILDVDPAIRDSAVAALRARGFQPDGHPTEQLTTLHLGTQPARLTPLPMIPGAAPARIGLGTAEISSLQRQYVNDVLDKNRLSYGEYTRRFEREFARLHDRRFAIFCNSGTSALQVAVHALKEHDGWEDGDEILVPAVTFVASSNVVLQNGLKPVFVDVEPDHMGIDPGQLAKHLTKRTRAVMPVHLFGQPCDMDAIMAFAKANNLRVIEDSCETMFVRYKGRPTGSWGDVACFSTYVAHLIVTGVGGLAATNHEPLAVLMKSLMNHGRDSIYLSIDDDDDTKDEDVLKQLVARRFSFVHVGYSYRGTEMEAALGVGELARYQEMLSRRQENARYLSGALADLTRYLQLPSVRKGAEHAWMMYPVIVKEGVDREDLLLHLETAGIETRHLMPLINQPIYRKLFGDLEPQYPVAARINRNGFAIGCHQGLDRGDLEHVVAAFHNYFARR